jgi:type II secretion system protein G
MRKNLKAPRGFTIVELLIVIVVIAILASISVVAYSGVQQRARDTRRVSDMNTIVKALEMYKIQTGSYPVASGTNTIVGWEVSSKNPDQFLSALKTSGLITSVPVDPVNDNTTSISGFLYRYYRYNAGANGCDASRGAYYVLVVGDAESTSGQLDSSPGFSCSGRSWSTDGGWITGAYTN